MPAFESLILGEKTAVIFDIGSVYTKCGFAGETGPRFIFPTEVTQQNGQTRHFLDLKTHEEKRKFLLIFLHQLYYRHLLVNPKDRRVVVVESILCTTEFRELLADVLFNHFEVPSVLFAPAHLVTLFTLGLSTALVLDCGYKESVVIPVAEGYSLLNAWQASQLGSHAVYQNMKHLLKRDAVLVESHDTSCKLADYSDNENLLTRDVLEDLMVRTCFVSPLKRADEWFNWYSAQLESSDISVLPPKTAETDFIYPLSDHSISKTLQIPSYIRELSVECLFRGDNDRITLATLILKSIMSCPIDIRRSLAANLIIIGGTSNIPGFANRLGEELNACLELDEFSSLKPLSGTFRIHAPPAEPNYVAWLGGAIFGALECLPGRSLERSVYLEKKCLPDWTTMIDAGPLETTERHEVTRQ